MTSNIAFGCSHTFGIGVEPHESWPALLELMNFGKPGVSVDFIARTCEARIIEHSPECVYILWPDWTRFEYERDGRMHQSLPTDKNRREFMDKDNDWLRKNWLIGVCKIEDICKQHSAQLICLKLDDLETIIDHQDRWPPASDGSHFGPQWHRWVADLFNVRKSFISYAQHRCPP